MKKIEAVPSTASLIFMIIFIETGLMFSLFGKKEDKIKITDRIFISSAAKQNAILAKVLNQPGLIIIAWFDESYNQVKALLGFNNPDVEIYMARELTAHLLQNKSVLFFDHYPLFTKEYELLEKLQLSQVIFYSSLDESLFVHFGGEKMISLLEEMGFRKTKPLNTR